MDIFLGILIAITFLGLVAFGSLIVYALIAAVFTGPKKIEKGILAAILGIFLFGFN
jgi:hypothetical protein